MKWQNENVVEDVKDELEDLDKVLNIVAQLPKVKAMRLLEYCRSYVVEKDADIAPGVSSNAFIEEMKKKFGISDKDQ